MRTEQINLVVSISKSGSITKAAEELFLSQPTASHMLNSLEQELGYVIFTRGHSGSMLTEKGEEFMKYAGTLRRTLEHIANLGKEEETQRFSVLSYQYSFVENAFLHLCKEYIQTPMKMEFKLRFIDNLDDVSDSLEQSEADVAIGICREDLFGTFDNTFRLRSLVTETLCSMPLHVTVSKNHPMAYAENVSIADYISYPCLSSIGYDKQGDYACHTVTDYAPFLRKTIYLDPGEARVRLAAETDGFIVSTPFLKETLERYNLIGKPIPESNVRFFTIFCDERRNDPLIMRFTGLLRKEVATLC